MSIYANEPRFYRESDAATIQAAVDFAAESGEGRVIIPHLTADGRRIWSIDKCILLPSDMTVILRDCHLRMADGVRENMFRNQNAWTPLGNTLAGEQHDIRLIGEGNALLDGGEPNGLCEQLHREDPQRYPVMYVNLTVFLHNVRHFEVRNIRFTECRYWAVCFMFCRWGRASELDFRMRGNLENQDGIDLRIGCEYITVENITGITGDDTVALTALPAEKTAEQLLLVEGKSVDIHDVTVQNVTSSTHGCGIVRLLNAQGARLYNVTVRDVKDTGETISGAAVMVGTTDPYLLRDHPSAMGDFRNILLQNIFTHAQKAISFSGCCRDLTVENVVAQERCEIGLAFNGNFVAENVLIRNFTYRGNATNADSVFACYVTDPQALAGLAIERVCATAARYTFRGIELPLRDAALDAPLEGRFTPETHTLASAYGRYHKYFYGKLITNRPPDNRIDGTGK
ncbi:MAG: hypothetical protein E7585_06250 [Ruminococcaceae bacterium]|nr:hypothetical protein [Oscillospiraceae bacterium]